MASNIEGLLDADSRSSFGTTTDSPVTSGTTIEGLLDADSKSSFGTTTDSPVTSRTTIEDLLDADSKSSFGTTISEVPQQPLYDDSFSNRVGIAWDGMKSSMYEGLGVLSDTFGMEDSAKDFKATAQRFEQSARNRPQSRRTPSITTEAPKIAGQISEGEIDEAFFATVDQANALSAAALPSLVPSIAAQLGTKVTAPFLRFIPVVGKPAALIYRIVGSMTPGFLMGAGEIHQRAKELGATDKEANLYALGGGTLVGALDAFGARLIINSFTKAVGKKNAVAYLAKTVPEKVAKETVEKATKTGAMVSLSQALKGIVKGGVKGGIQEGGTEAVQEFVQVGAAAQAAEKELKAPETIFQMIDAFALGVFGGGPVGGLGEGMSALVKKEALNRSEEIEQDVRDVSTTVANAATDLESNLQSSATATEPGKIKAGPAKIVRRATSYLKDAANRTPESGIGKALLNDLNNYYNNINQEVGKVYSQAKEIFVDLKKDFKLPFTKAIPKKTSTKVTRVFRGQESSNDPKINRAASTLRTLVGDVDRNEAGEVIRDENGKPRNPTGLYKMLVDSGVDVNYMDNYLSQVYKLPITGFGRRKAKKKFIEILKNNNARNPLVNKKLREKAEEIVNSIAGNNNNYNVDDSVNLFPAEGEGPTLPVTKRSFELPRHIPPEVVKELDKAGLVENNIEGLINKLIISNVKRAEIQRIFNTYNKEKEALKFNPDEIKYTRKIFQALQNNYKPIETDLGRVLNQFAVTAGYITTLPLASFVALAEPFIVLSRVDPKNALYGAMQATVTGARKAWRTLRPKFKLSALEKSFDSLMQTADLSLQESIRDIGDLSVHKKITDRFFRLNLLAQVTQFSRHIAFAAAQRQMKEDIQLIEQEMSTGKRTIETTRARRRLREQGLGNILSGRQRNRPKFEAVLPVKPPLPKGLQESDLDLAKKYTSLILPDSMAKNDALMEKYNKSKKVVKWRKEMKKYETKKKSYEARLENFIKGEEALPEIEKQILNWSRVSDTQVPPPDIITRALGKTVDEVIMSPNVVNRPLWMSDPHYATVAQLKGFMMTFGNTIMPKIYNEILKPLNPALMVPSLRKKYGLEGERGGLNPEAAFRYALTFGLIFSALYGTMVMKNAIRYGDDEDNPVNDLKGAELMFYLLKQSNILGYGNILLDSINSSKYGVDPLVAGAGPVWNKLSRFFQSIWGLKEGRPRQLANWLSKNTPFYGALSSKRREPWTETIEEFLEEYSPGGN